MLSGISVFVFFPCIYFSPTVNLHPAGCLLLQVWRCGKPLGSNHGSKCAPCSCVLRLSFELAQRPQRCGCRVSCLLVEFVLGSFRRSVTICSGSGYEVLLPACPSSNCLRWA
ncbi:hypothetical protein B0T20DRAFT_236826 [Sordaria brevicollis]|uniref:Uncharacterized protein n=1 Tax=Sordaria brevicollis TaxID=83679 RepID=A0AAE0PDJ3_SORBR|nr:hypothetical protein B0T20DRAFT_236826 [Sordaria brevicollis]